MSNDTRKDFEIDFDVPDYLEFDGEQYMYYGDAPMLKEQQQDIHSKWSGYKSAAKSLQAEIRDLRAENESLFNELEMLKEAIG